MPDSAVHWSQSVDARNPGNVPRKVTYGNERFKPLDPVSPKALALLRRRLHDHEATDDDIAAMFGTGYSTLPELSAWSASWALDELAAAWTHRDLDVELKAYIARHYQSKDSSLRRNPDV